MKYVGLVLIILFSSCNNCRNNDCANNATLKVEIVDSNGNNLLAIPDQIYSFQTIEVTGIVNGQTVPLKRIDRTDFIQVVMMLDQTDVIISYGELERDTFKVANQQIIQDECCGSILEDFDASFKENNICLNCSTTIATIIKEQ